MTNATTTSLVSPALREQFEQDGYVVIKEALSRQEVDVYTGVLDRYYASQVAADVQRDGAAMHHLSAVAAMPPLVNLIDHPKTFPMIWSILGWNIHIYHSHADVHPQITTAKPYRFEWHQDGGRQNRELETEPRPRLSVKIAYWLSDLSEPGRGNFKVIPGSHLTNWLEGPPRRDVEWPEPPGSVEVCVDAGDAVIFDRRLWHTRTDNYSPVRRKGIFFAYSHRWSYARDENDGLYASPAFANFTPVQQQLLAAKLAGPGEIPGDHQWGHYPETTPLYGHLRDAGALDPAYPPLQP